MTRSYGQFCPIAKAAEVFCERWTALLLRELGTGSTRFAELKRGVPTMSPTMLSRRLKELTAEGVVERRAAPGGATYHLTEAGREFLPVVMALGEWGQRWTRRQLADGEVDHRLLLWDMERTVRAAAFDAQARGHTSVVQLHFPDLTGSQSDWWFVNRTEPGEVPGEVQLCLDDPGFDTDLYLTATVADLIHIWRGDIGVDRALADGRLEAHGPRSFTRRLEAWLTLSPFAGVQSARGETG
jgi:DNA-binding HxlR family transcriptional regulator